MTLEQFNEAVNNYELEQEWADFVYNNYPDRVSFEDFAERMVTE